MAWFLGDDEVVRQPGQPLSRNNLKTSTSYQVLQLRLFEEPHGRHCPQLRQGQDERPQDGPSLAQTGSRRDEQSFWGQQVADSSRRFLHIFDIVTSSPDTTASNAVQQHVPSARPWLTRGPRTSLLKDQGAPARSPGGKNPRLHSCERGSARAGARPSLPTRPRKGRASRCGTALGGGRPSIIGLAWPGLSHGSPERQITTVRGPAHDVLLQRR